MSNSNIGLIGLAVMGANLARNIANHGTKVFVFNRSRNRTDEFIKGFGNEMLEASYSLEELVGRLESPRKIILMVKSGDPVDEIINQLIPLLSEGDIVIDCGNSFYKDTKRRFEKLLEYKLHFIGCGVSGGEEGALNGPSLMPGGNKEVWENNLKSIFEPIAARDFNNGSCVSYIGNHGAGHYVKMVHNGIEYGIMQIMAELYAILKNHFKFSAGEISEIFQRLSEGKLKSYLFEIAVDVLAQKDDLTGGYLIDSILDKAGSKGTGMWTSVDALERGMPLPSITLAVFARYISSLKTERESISKEYGEETFKSQTPNFQNTESELEDAIYLAVLSVYSQGLELINQASKEENWNINFSELVRIWQGGCIIRAELLGVLQSEFAKSSGYKHMLRFEFIKLGSVENIGKLRHLCSLAIKAGVSIPSIYSSLEYIESMKSERLSANFIQGLRDYFGAHTYERIDKEGSFHTKWNNKF
ncbi:NADP-dependent phosphogluconate dehydrogenase [Candidatus Dojkabacteria bacterium]|nr:NADP-dependent phosphogluconate dehydrogenase [Candidatus Dojkabacteria bacterium]